MATRCHLTDADAKQHTLVLGTIGSGKTVAILNVVESAIQRQLPMVYVDGKGDYALAQRVISYATARGWPAYLFAMNGDSCLYNPACRWRLLIEERPDHRPSRMVRGPLSEARRRLHADRVQGPGRLRRPYRSCFGERVHEHGQARKTDQKEQAPARQSQGAAFRG